MESFMCIYFITIKNEENKQNTIATFRKALEWPRMSLLSKRTPLPTRPVQCGGIRPYLSPHGTDSPHSLRF